jgi:F420-0:gamma-glutamyl ligase
MIATPIKTNKILPGQQTIFEVLDKTLLELKDASVVAVTSKIIALCENRVIPIGSIGKEELVAQEADYYLPGSFSRYDYHFSIKNHTLTALAGIDESNSAGNYVLWPKDPQKSANDIREFLKDKFNLNNVGVVITDSTSAPMRLGTVGLALSYSGFKPLNNYVGKEDLFHRPFEVSRAGIAMGLANAAVLLMGEGAEQTPIVVMEDLPFVKFKDHNPTPKDLELFYLKDKKEDLFGPFFSSVEWQKGRGGKS